MERRGGGKLRKRLRLYPRAAGIHSYGMTGVAKPLSAPMLEFLEWVRFRPRTYADAMDAWGSHCPRFTLWEDALDQALIQLEPGESGTYCVRLTRDGRAALNAR